MANFLEGKKSEFKNGIIIGGAEMFETWSEEKTYTLSAVVSFEGGIYLRTAEDNNNELNPIDNTDWKLLANIDSGVGEDFMTLNSGNEVTEEWSIDSDNLHISSSNISLNNETESTNISPSSISLVSGDTELTLSIYNPEGGLGTISSSDDGVREALLELPNSGNDTRYIPVSVNGVYANQQGEITIPTGSGLTLEQTRQNGNIFNGDIEFYNPTSASLYFGNGTDSTSSTKSAIFGTDYDNNKIYLTSNFGQLSGTIFFFSDRSFTVNMSESGLGIVGSNYYGAQYVNNSFIQKKYVDDNFLSKPSVAGDNGQVLTSNGSGGSTWSDINDFQNLLGNAGNLIFTNSTEDGFDIRNFSGRDMNINTVTGARVPVWTSSSQTWRENGYIVGDTIAGSTIALRDTKGRLKATTAVDGTHVVNLDQLNSSLANYIIKPATDGTPGQVLTTNGSGGVSWTTVSGGGGGTIPNLQQVTDIGNITNKQIIVRSGYNREIMISNERIQAGGGTSARKGLSFGSGYTSNYLITLPNKSGTVALLDDALPTSENNKFLVGGTSGWVKRGIVGPDFGFSTTSTPMEFFPVWQNNSWVSRVINIEMSAMTIPMRDGSSRISMGNATDSNHGVNLGQLNTILEDNIHKIQIEVSGDQTIQPTWKSKEITFMSSGILTIPNDLEDEFSFTLAADIGTTITWDITAPYTWRVAGLPVGVAPPDVTEGQFYQVSKRKGTNEIRVRGFY